MWEKKYGENNFKIGSEKTQVIERSNCGVPCDREEAVTQYKAWKQEEGICVHTGR
jgi:hypothetical protein